MTNRLPVTATCQSELLLEKLLHEVASTQVRECRLQSHKSYLLRCLAALGPLAGREQIQVIRDQDAAGKKPISSEGQEGAPCYRRLPPAGWAQALLGAGIHNSTLAI